MTPMPQHIDFIGIGGIGMSALAHGAMANDIKVTGYDRVATRITDALQVQGADIRWTESTDDWHIPEDALVVYTPAVPTTHPQLAAALAGPWRVIKRSQALAEIANAGTCLAIAGTHGKTTTSAMLTWILHQANVPVQAFLGGLANNLDGNCLPGPAEITIVEADEFDRSFLHLQPSAAVVTSTDADHLDIYDHADALTGAFQEFANLVDGPVFRSSQAQVHGTSYGLDAQHWAHASHLHVKDGRQVFDLHLGDEHVEKVTAGLPGSHNIENALAAACVAHHVGVGIHEIADGISSFEGVWRRFDVRVHDEAHVFIDDYAHHPTEITRLHQAVRQLFPEDEIAILFQPHLFSRTRDFMDGFASALSAFDHVGLMPIYPAREAAIPGVTSEALAESMEHVTCLGVDDAVEWLAHHPARVKMTVGAGDIDRLVESVEEQLKHSMR